MSIFSDGDLDRLRDPVIPSARASSRTGCSDHPLLTLEALVELGKRLPRESVEYNAGDLPYGVDPGHGRAIPASRSRTRSAASRIAAAGWC